jgi:arabinofuranan 3-O-arabinosyltransferase
VTATAPGVAPARAAVSSVPPASTGIRRAGYALLALLAYVPVLLTAPGRVVADTKSYLYLDPGRLLDRAASMWDPNIGMGTVTHQNIGYLFPMGPFFWVFHMLGVPAWVSQRIWLGSIFLFAGLGILYLMRTLSVRGPGVPVAVLLFMLTPYSLDFASRISVLLLPFAALPWMLGLVIRALRDDGGWRYPAIFAIVIQVVGGVNATALVFAGIAPVLWILYAATLSREVDWRRALAVTAKIGLLTVLASLWWIAGLSIQSGYGLNVLKYTETLEVVSQASVASEVLRGLGYWFFYGRDRLGPWTESSVGYTQHLWLITVGFAIPVLAMFAAGCVRWRHRAYFVLLALVGVTVAVGAHPYDNPSVLGGLFKSFAESSSFGLALRSTGRAVPLVALAFAVLLGVGVNAVARRLSRRGMARTGLVLAGLVMVLAVLNLPSLWDDTFYGSNLQRDEAIPDYWTQAIAAMDAGPHDTRVLELPGADFASYRWGNTVDPITPGLMDRPYVARELIPWGSAASADLLNALDRRLQEGVLDPSAIAPIARLMNVGDVVYRADLETDRFDLARAVPTWMLLQAAEPNGLGPPSTYGTSLGPPLRESQLDELALATPPDAAQPPPVSIFSVRNPKSIVSVAPSAVPIIVSGDGEGLVDLATTGALSGDNIVLYSGTFAGDPAALRAEAKRPGALLVVTDSNRKRGRRWGAIKDVEGATERADESALVTDESDAQLDVFPAASTTAQTVVDEPGAQVSTTRYGNRITYWQEERGSRAFDGDTSTAWEFGTHAAVVGDRLRLDLDQPITTDHVNLVQRLNGTNTRTISQVTLTFDGANPVQVALDDSSRTPTGQTVTFPKRTFHRMDITVDDTNVGKALTEDNNNVGFAEIRLRDDAPGATDVRVDEIVRMPTDMVDTIGRAAAGRPLVYQMSRSRTIVVPPRTAQDEPALVRRFEVPDTRTFGAGGTVRVATAAPDAVIDSVLGLPDASAGGITVRASEHLPGSVTQRGSAAFDGDPATAWSTAFGNPQGQWVEVQTPAPVTFGHLDLQVVADGRHSVPTQIQIDSGGQSRTVDLPAITDQKAPNATVSVPVDFEPLTGDTTRVTVTAVRPVTTIEYHENVPITMPVALAEVGMPGVREAPLPATMPSACRTDLLTLDGRSVGIRLGGTPASAQALGAIDVELCDPTSPDGPPPTLALGKGTHLLRSVPGTVSGIDVDGLVLGSEAGGAPMAVGAGGRLPASATAVPVAARAATPKVTVTHNGRTKISVHVSGAHPGTPFWLVLGQSNNAGWQATVAGKDVGGSTLVNGYANGWLVQPGTQSFDVTLKWTPQNRVWIALAVSAAALVVCCFLAFRRRRRAAPERAATVDAEPELASPMVASGTRPSVGALVAGPVIAGLVGAVLVRGWVGVVAALCVLAVLLRPRLRPLLTFGAPLALGLCALYVVVQQYRYRYFSDFDWPSHFERVDELAWLSIILLAADVLVERLRAPWPKARSDEPAPVPYGPDDTIPSGARVQD